MIVYKQSGSKFVTQLYVFPISIQLQTGPQSHLDSFIFFCSLLIFFFSYFLHYLNPLHSSNDGFLTNRNLVATNSKHVYARNLNIHIINSLKIKLPTIASQTFAAHPFHIHHVTIPNQFWSLESQPFTDLWTIISPGFRIIINTHFN